jgi:eukaryotic-like serine/threonine-protein kinase
MALAGAADFPGTQRFEVIRRLGAGGMGVVYEAFDRERSSRVALKTVRDLGGEDLLRLKNEFRALQDLTHPNLVSLGELLEQDGRWFFTMELVEGTSFIEYVRPGAPRPVHVPGQTDSNVSPDAKTGEASPPHRVWESSRPAGGPGYDERRLRLALEQLARALGAAHAAGKVHRDIKPSNILVTPADRLVLLDFGLVTGVAPGDRSSAAHAVGTADYMAPEQAASQRVGPPADWYSVGVLLYQALTGHLPFAGAPLEVMLKKHQHDPEPPRAGCPAVPEDLDALCVSLLRFDPQARPTAAEVLERLGVEDQPARSTSSASVTQAPLFVGREEELLLLEEAFAASRKGAAVVVVEGSSGVGKSALVQRFVERLEHHGAVILAGRCYEREAVPYRGIDSVIDALSNYMGRLSNDAATALLPRSASLIGDVFPVMRRVKAVTIAPRIHTEAQVDPQELRSRLFAAMRELFCRLADRHPLVVVIDDLQWADADSLSMIGEVLRPPEAPALLAVATVRTGPESTTPDMVRVLPSEPRRLRLGPLPPAEARELAATLLRRVGQKGTVSPTAIAVEARGHPLFIDALVRHAAFRQGKGSISFRLDEALRARVAELPPAARRVLELVVTAGFPLPQDLMARAASLQPAELARVLGLMRIDHLVQTTGTRGDDTVAPYHDRVREALGETMSEEARRGCHADLAVALEATAQPDPQLLAVHWQGAGDNARAAAYAERAAAAAAGAFAFDRAVTLYRMAVDLRPPDDKSVHQLQVKLGDALANAGRGAEAAEAYGRAAADAQAAEALDLRRRAAIQLLKSGHLDEGAAAIQALSGATGVRLARSPGAALASLVLRRGLVRLRGYGFRPRDPSQILPERLQRLDICLSIAAAFASLDTIRGNDLNARALLMALRAGEPNRLIRTFATEIALVSMSGGPARKRVERLIHTLTRLVGDRPRPEERAYASAAVGIADYYIGRFRPAAERFAEVERVWREECTGAVWELDTAHMFQLWLLTYLGRIAELSVRAPELVAQALDRGDRYAATNLRLSLQNVAWLVDGDVEEARRMARDALRGWSKSGALAHDWFGLTAETQLELYEGAGAEAFGRMERGWRALERSLIMRVQNVRIEAWGLRARAALAAAAAKPDDREQRLARVEADVRRIRKEKMAWGEPVADLALAGVAALRGDLAAAAGRCAAAARAFDAADMALHAAVARRRQGLLVGGDEGGALIVAAEAWMRGQKISSPARWTAMLAPGFPE